MKKTLGGDRLGSGNRMQVELHNYGRSNQNLSYKWRSTMSVGTLVPFMCEVGLPGDTFDIDLNAKILTHPTLGPCFGEMKAQFDVFMVPWRLYNALMHNNDMNAGRNMAAVKTPKLNLNVYEWEEDVLDLSNSQINPSCLLAYLGIRGVGNNLLSDTQSRNFNAIPMLAYYEIYKNYYAAKQESLGWIINGTPGTINTDIATFDVNGSAITLFPSETNVSIVYGNELFIAWNSGTPSTYAIQVKINGQWVALTAAFTSLVTTGVQLSGIYNGIFGNAVIESYRFANNNDAVGTDISLTSFSLTTIDEQRAALLGTYGGEYMVNTGDFPYAAFDNSVVQNQLLYSQQGLAVKTYQSDQFNNWLNTEWLDGTGGINDITAVDTSSGEFKIDALILARKVYEIMNRIIVSGGSGNDWQEAVWGERVDRGAESPVYIGGLSKEIIFQEVVSNADSNGQPLGTLGGRGTTGSKHKGGKVVARCTEPCYIMGIVSITPYLDYSQGNRWDVHLDNWDELHKPGMDEIGFEELIQEKMAWWTTYYDDALANVWKTKSAGKQPAWTDYMTNHNRTFGNFANDSEMWMTLNRRYEGDIASAEITDLTSYIDPMKWNNIFADTAIDAQNFWVQMHVGIQARRKLSAKLMPNL